MRSIKRNGYLLAPRNSFFANEVINSLGWTKRSIEFVKFQNNKLEIKLNYLPENELEFDQLYESLLNIKTVANTK